MSRVPEIRDRAQLDESDRHLFDEVETFRGPRVAPPFAVMFNAPESVLHAARLSTYLRTQSLFPKDIWELAVIVTARHWECEVTWGHRDAALAAGIAPAVIDVVDRSAPTAGLPDDQALIIDFTRSLLRTNRVSDEQFRAVQDRWGDRGSIQLTTLIGYYSLVSIVLNACDVRRLPADGA